MKIESFRDLKKEGGLRTIGKFHKISVPGKPLISIITVVLNCEKHLKQTIQSVINQTYDNIEYIIVDGDSTDGTLDIVRKYDNQIAYWICERDSGIYHAMNKGVKASTGDWIIFLNSGDYFFSDQVLYHLNPYVNRAKKDGINIIYGKKAIIDNFGKVRYLTGDSWEKLKQNFLHYMNISHPGMLHARSLFNKIGFFDESFKICGDYEFLLRELRHHTPIFVDSVFVGFPQSGISNNYRNLNIILQEEKKIRQIHGIKTPLMTKLLKHWQMKILWMFSIIFGHTLTKKIHNFIRKVL